MVEDQSASAERKAEVKDLDEAWTRVLAGLPPNQRAWLTNSRPVTLHESTAIVAVPDDFTRGQLETRLRPDLERILTESFGRDIRIAVTVDPSLDPELREPAAPVQPVVQAPAPAMQPIQNQPLGQPMHQAFGQPHQPIHQPPPQQQIHQPLQQPVTAQPLQEISQQPLGSVAPPPNGSAPTQPATEAQGEARLNPKYTFETFVIGSSNRFAHAAAVAVAEAPGKAYNPQLIYGDSGLGKTHLLHAIGHYVRSLYTGARVRYVSSEEFTNDFINAIRDDKAAQFQRRYRDVDVLLIDDIQFLEGKIQTQEEFFHTFNTLHNANKQIVISSDRAPKRLEALEDRLRNRFEWGLITDIQPPDLETRIAILRKKAATERLTAPPEVLEFIASKVQTNIRELEGALIRVTAFASLNRQPVDLSLAEIVLKDLIPEGSKPEVTASMIMGQTASYFGLVDRRPVRIEPEPGARDGPADRDVPVPRTDRSVAAEDRSAVRRPGPHHRDARGAEDPSVDVGAAQRLQPGDRVDQPDQAPGQAAMTGRVTASTSVYAERNDAVTRTTQAGDSPVDNCGYVGGHSRLACGFAVWRKTVVTSRPKKRPISSTSRAQPKTCSDLRTRGFSTVSTGAKNPMESVRKSQSTKGCWRPTWGKPRFRASCRARLTDLSGCPQNHRNDGDATRPNRHVKPGWRTSHLSVAGSAWHTAESGGTQR